MITSAHNPKIQTVRALLAHRQEREAAGEFVIEGVRLTEEALNSGWIPRVVFHSVQVSERGKTLLMEFARNGVEIEEISPGLMKSLAETDAPQGILAVVPQRTLGLPVMMDFAVIADNLRDPGNLGTLLRTAAAAGVQAVLLAPGTADAFSPKVLRAGMGAHFRLPVHRCSWDEITGICRIKSHPELQVLLAEAENGLPFWSHDLRKPLALVIGGEAEGASPAGRALANAAIKIPMPGLSESLNAAVAAGILIFEVVRQRNL